MLKNKKTHDISKYHSKTIQGIYLLDYAGSGLVWYIFLRNVIFRGLFLVEGGNDIFAWEMLFSEGSFFFEGRDDIFAREMSFPEAYFFFEGWNAL